MMRRGERPRLRWGVCAALCLTALNVYIGWGAAPWATSDASPAAVREAIARAQENARALGAALEAADRQLAELRALSGAGGGAAPLSGSHAVARPAVWLRIVMPCHSRPSPVHYVRATVLSILSQLPAADPLRDLVEVLVVDTDARADTNLAFAALRAELAAEPLVRFAQLAAGADGGARRASGSIRASLSARVKVAVQQQTLDLAAVFRLAAALAPSARLVLAAEDDWVLCPNGLLALLHFVREATRLDPRWKALRCSYGFNGVVVRGEELRELAAHLAAHSARRPPDHLVYEWFSNEWASKQPPADGDEAASARSYRVYRHNLWYHIGQVSTLSQPANRFTPRCYELLYDWLLPAETFKRDQCPHADVWPCTQQAPQAQAHGGLGLFERFAQVDFAMGKRDAHGKVPAGEPSGARVRALSAPERTQPRAQGLGAGAAGGAGAVRTGLLGASCDATCAAHGGARCVRAHLAALNTCEQLRAHFACVECSASAGADQPAQVDIGAPAPALPGHCVYNSPPDARFDCAASHALTRRLCPCA
jgi:hypothetical protein